jgi:hypothetical protein
MSFELCPVTNHFVVGLFRVGDNIVIDFVLSLPLSQAVNPSGERE